MYYEKRINWLFNNIVETATTYLITAIDNDCHRTSTGKFWLKLYVQTVKYVYETFPERRAEFALRVMKGVWK